MLNAQNGTSSSLSGHCEGPQTAVAEAAAAIRERLAAAADACATATPPSPEIALVLGSGLGPLAERINTYCAISYRDIPHFSISGAPGHAGQLLFGELAGQQVVCMQGRLHGYEGHSPEQVVFPLRVLRALGAKSLIITNAAGCINTEFEVGDAMLITDHINLTGANPLTLTPGRPAGQAAGAAAGQAPDQSPDQGGNVFIDMSFAYTPRLRDKARQAAASRGITLREGVYIGVRGPCFETPAEIRAFRVMGADACGMSTVHEVITAASLGMEVLGFSLMTNMAAGILPQPLTGQEVLDVAREASGRMQSLITGVLADWQ